MKQKDLFKGNFELHLSDNQIHKINLYKRVFLLISLIIVLVPIFVKQSALIKASKILPLSSSYAFSLILLAMIIIFNFIVSFLSLKIRNIMPFADFPKNTKTHYSTYFYVVIALIHACLQIGITIWTFSLPSLVVSICSVIILVCSILYYRITKFAYQNAEYITPSGQRISMKDKDSKEVRLDTSTPPPQQEEEKTNLPKLKQQLENKQSTENNEENENDFYD